MQLLKIAILLLMLSNVGTEETDEANAKLVQLYGSIRYVVIFNCKVFTPDKKQIYLQESLLKVTSGRTRLDLVLEDNKLFSNINYTLASENGIKKIIEINGIIGNWKIYEMPTERYPEKNSWRIPEDALEIEGKIKKNVLNQGFFNI